MTKLEQLKTAYETATPGKWRQKSWHEGAVLDDEGRMVAAAYAPHDATFIALAHNLMPHLLEAAEFLGDVRDLLANHPEADEGNSKVHFILCNAKGLLKELTR